MKTELNWKSINSDISPPRNSICMVLLKGHVIKTSYVFFDSDGYHFSSSEKHWDDIYTKHVTHFAVINNDWE